MTELFPECRDTKRLMLIGLPERNLYSPDWLLIILSHEVSHFVGDVVRNRQARHRALWECGCRIFELEMKHFLYILTDEGLREDLEKILKEDTLLDDLKWQFERINAAYEERISSESRRYMYHSGNSIARIRGVFREYGQYYLDKMVADEAGKTKQSLSQDADRQGVVAQLEKKINFQRDLTRQCDSYRKQLPPFFRKFQGVILEQLLGMMRYLMAEACADLNAVLTLGLSPRRYVCSFTDNNNDARDGLIDATHTTIRTVRVGLVLVSIRNLVTGNRDWFQEYDDSFRREWDMDDVLESLSEDTAQNTVTGRFAESIRQYVKNIRNCSDKISVYRSLYDDSVGKREFTNHELDFLNDRLIWNSLSGYLDECAEDYLAIIQKSSQVWEKRKYLSSVYDTAKNGSAADVMMNVESFLQQYEERERKS